MKYLTTYTLIIFLLASCHKNPALLENNQTFNEQETKELICLMDRFEKTLCQIEGMDTEQTSTCFDAFAKRLKKESQDDNFNIGIDSLSQQDILSCLSQNLKHEIWFYGMTTVKRRTSKNEIITDSFPSVSLNNKKYFDFLKNEVSPINSNTQKYFKTLEVAGSISPSMAYDLIENYSKYDMQDERIKLLVAIHHLTLNQPNSMER